MPRHYLLERADRAWANRTGDVRHDLALFVELLRSIGVGVSSGSSLQAMQALTVVRLDDIRDFRAALDCCLSSCAEDRLLFDGIFEVFWSAEDTEVPALRGGDEGGGNGDTLRGAGELSAQTTEPAAQGRADRDGLTGHATYSRSRGQGSTVTARHRREIDELSRRLARALGTAPGRRLVTGAHGDLVDLRASLRHNLRFGDEMLLLRHTTRRRDRPRIVVLCDVSSSMRPYTPLFLAFVHSLTKIVRGVESAVFNVELSMVTEVFRGTNLRQALEWLGHQQVALSGGTWIGHSLHSFLDNLEHRGVMRSDTIALILSDGWDVGDGELLQDGMRRLRDQVGRVVWCDPHAASTDYHPQVPGLRLALPLVDDYLDFSTVGSLAQLVTRLEHRTQPQQPALSASNP